MKRILSGAIVAAALGSFAVRPALAQAAVDNTAYGTTSAEFLLLGAGARGAALGGAFASIATDVTSLYWNPAGLAQMERPSMSASTYSYLADTRYSWVGIGFPMDGGQSAIGFHGATFGFSDQKVYTVDDPEGALGVTYSVAETYLAGTYSRNFSDRFSAGFTAKFVSDKLGDVTGTAFAFDFGTSFHAMVGGNHPIRASFVIQNLGSTLKHSGAGLDAAITRTPPTGTVDIPQEPAPGQFKTKDFGLPVMFRVALAFDFVNSESSRITLLSEFNQPNNNAATAGGALEWALPLGSSGFDVTARGGYTYQPANNITPDATAAGFTSALTSDGNKEGLAFGGGLGYHRGGKGIGLDYAYRNMGVLGGTNFMSATISW
jgi:hypothetical protein